MKRAAITAAIAVASCRVPQPPAPPAARAPRSEAGAILRPARYLVGEHARIETTSDGLDRVVTDGRRIEVRGLEIVSAAPAEPEIEGGARMPPWVSGPFRYVFWKGKRLWGAERFGGELVALSPLPADPIRAFDWVDGAGLLLQGGAVVIDASGKTNARASVPAVVDAVAADARRGVALTALGHAWLTLDGGASYRDATRDLGGTASLDVRGDAIVATLHDGRERAVSASGAVIDSVGYGAARVSPRAPARSGPPQREPDPFTDATSESPVDIAARVGLPLADGGVVITSHGFVGRLDLATLRTTSLAALDPDLRDADCTPVRVSDGIVLACVGPERASVIDLDGAPRTERSFDLAGASELDRFVVADGEAIGYIGPCDGSPTAVPEAELLPSLEPSNPSRARSPVFCARAGRDEWIEHRLDPADATDVFAWIPRAGGGAAAMVLRNGNFLEDRDRVSVRGALRVVRLARSEPPLSFVPAAYQEPAPISRSLRIGADDVIDGWMRINGYGPPTVAVSIDASGHARAYDVPPRMNNITTAGRFALGIDDESRVWETVDAGHRWAEVDPPPAAHVARGLPSAACSPAGCVVGSFVRLGWTAAEGEPMPHNDARSSPMRETYHRPEPRAPLVRLVCSPASLPEGRRVVDTMGFGYTTQPQPQGAVPGRIPGIGMATLPWSGQQIATTGDSDVAWIAPLDVTGRVSRLTVPLARLGLSSIAHRGFELRTGPLLTPSGVDLFAVGAREQCWSSLLEFAGIARPLGACAEDPAVGVDVSGRVFVVHGAYDALAVAIADAAPPPSRSRGALPAIASPLHEVHRTPVAGSLRGFALAVGVREASPVAIMVDANGGAALAPIDREQGTFGAEETLRPLGDARIGSDPACAPRAGDARVVFPFDGLIGLDRTSIRSVSSTGTPSLAVLRWSRDRVCVDALEIAIRDERFDETPAIYEPHGVVRKIVARFDRGAQSQASLVVVGMGSELRQRLTCSRLVPGDGGSP